jgi:hypothetical protein
MKKGTRYIYRLPLEKVPGTYLAAKAGIDDVAVDGAESVA